MPNDAHGEGERAGSTTEREPSRPGKGIKATISRRGLLVSGTLAISGAVHGQPQSTLQVDAFYHPEDGENWAPTFTRAFAAGKLARKDIACTPGKKYRIWSNVNILPGNDGWTSILYGNGATVIIGHTPVQSGDDSGGFRYRGIKSGELSNVSRGGIQNITINAQFISANSGVYSIFVENGGGLIFDRVDGLNYIAGFHICLFRYADGGSVSGSSVMKNCKCSGNVLKKISEPTWYPYLNSGDLTVGMPGDKIAPNASIAISTPVKGTSSSGSPLFASLLYWTNNGRSEIVIPRAPYTEDDIIRSGFTKSTSHPLLNGQKVGLEIEAYYSSGGSNIAKAVIQGVSGDTVENCQTYGGRYSIYFSGHNGPRIYGCDLQFGTRGIAVEWSVRGLKAAGNTIRETLSSGFLIGYGSTGWDIRNTTIIEQSQRWVGESLINIQLGSGNGVLYNTRITTRNSVENGQYHLHIAVNTSNVDVNNFYSYGDCKKSYVCVESAWNSRISKQNIESYPQSTTYDGGASMAMSGITLENVKIVADTVKTPGHGATAFCFMQVRDEKNGNIRLSNIEMIGCEALSDKHIEYVKLYRDSDHIIDLDKIRIIDCKFGEKIPA